MIVCDQSVSKAQYQKQQEQEEMEEEDQEQEQKEQKQEEAENDKTEEEEHPPISSGSMEEESKPDSIKPSPSVYGDAQEGRTVFIRTSSDSTLTLRECPCGCYSERSL